MSSGNTPGSEPPHQQLQREQRKADILRQRTSLRLLNAISVMYLRNAGSPLTHPATEQEVNRRRSIEARERRAIAEREQELDRLQKELDEINRIDRANSPVGLDVSDSDALFPEGPGSAAGVAAHQAIDPEDEDAGISDADDEREGSDGSDKHEISDEENTAGASENPSANLPRTRSISMKALNEQGLIGVGTYSDVYRSEATDALYFLSDLGEKIWLTDENGDCVLAQGQNL